MNKYIKFGLIFAAGFGAGYGVSYVVEKPRFEQRLNEELEKNQDYMVKLLGYQTPGEKDIPKELEEEPATAEEQIDISSGKKEIIRFEKTEKLDAKKDEILKKHSRIRYDRIPDPDFNESEVDEVSLKVNNDQPITDTGICIITADQFAKEHLAFEKEVLEWWPNEKLLTTEDGDILDVPDLIGTEWMDRIGEFTPDEVFVRNYTAETDYNIVQQHGSYYDYNE